MRQRTKLVAGSAVAVALLAGALFGGVLAESPSAGSTAVHAPTAISESALSEIAVGGTQATISRLESALASSPGNPDGLASLGLAYQVRWRETGDASYLPRSNGALRAALRARHHDPAATLGLGKSRPHPPPVRAGTRRRPRGHGGSRPTRRGPYGVIGDAQIELGRYPAAFGSFERMVSLKPNLASYARISYARELSGDPVGAIAAMQLALDAAGGQPEATAWVEVELGKLEFGRGRVTAADAHFRAALTIFPGYVYALEQRARVEAAPWPIRAPPSWPVGLRRRSRCRSSSDCSVTSSIVAGSTSRPDGSRRPWRQSIGCSSPAVSASTSSLPSTAQTTGFTPPRPSSWRAVRAPTGLRSTVTMRSAGHSRGRVGATRRRDGRSGRSASGRATRCSGSIAAMRPVAPATSPG